MSKRKYNEGANIEELLAIVKEMAALDESYPELGTPSRVRLLMENGNFSINKRPWDFLIALGYSKLSLSSEQNDKNHQAVSLLCNRAEKALKYPMKWMLDAITPELQNRYFKVAGECLPQAALLNRRMPRSLKGKCKVFAWFEYQQLLYVLRRFCWSPFVVDLPTACDEYWGILSVREMRDLVASMEKPPTEILQELNQQAAEIELKALNDDLRHALRRAKSLASLGYVLEQESAELKTLEEISQMLGATAAE